MEFVDGQNTNRTSENQCDLYTHSPLGICDGATEQKPSRLTVGELGAGDDDKYKSLLLCFPRKNAFHH